MNFKYFITFLQIAVIAIPKTKAQLGILSGLFGTVSNIQGTVFCTSKENMGVKGATIPVFPNQISTLYNMANYIVRKQLKHADELKSCSNTNEKDKNHTTKNVLEVKREKNRIFNVGCLKSDTNHGV
ncbi:hypothetical protein JHK87_042319 [Glycine soja]|nr:hypothetical protein JHK87_042319 [Glycine soja]